MFAIGVDLTRISRFSRLLQKPCNPYFSQRLPRKILSKPELEQFLALQSSSDGGDTDQLARFLAVRFFYYFIYQTGIFLISNMNI